MNCNLNLAASAAIVAFLLQLKPNLWLQVLLCGDFVSLGYVTQVSAISYVQKCRMRILFNDTYPILVLIQAVGFGTGMFMSRKWWRMNRSKHCQLLQDWRPQWHLLQWFWSFWWVNAAVDGAAGSLIDPSVRTVALAVFWTRVLSISTSLCNEITALGCSLFRDCNSDK